VAANPVKAHSDGQASKGEGARANGGSRSGDSKTVSNQGKAQSENRGAGTGKLSDSKTDGGGKYAGKNGSGSDDSKTGSRDVPSRNGATFQYSDGAQVTSRGGTVQSDGSISYRNGAQTSHDSQTGDTKTVGPDGQVHMYNPRTAKDQSLPSSTGSGDGKRTDPGKLTGPDKTSDSKERSGLGPDKTGSKYGGGRDDSGRSGQPSPGKNEKQPSGNSGRSDSGNGGKHNSGGNDNSNSGSGGNDKSNSGNTDKPDKNNDKPEKTEKQSKGRVVQDDQTGGSGGSSGQVRPGESDRGGSQDDASSKGTPRTLNRGTGPGGRTGGETSTGNASRLTLPANAPVINPGDTQGGGARTPIVPEGGKR